MGLSREAERPTVSLRQPVEVSTVDEFRSLLPPKSSKAQSFRAKVRSRGSRGLKRTRGLRRFGALEASGLLHCNPYYTSWGPGPTCESDKMSTAGCSSSPNVSSERAWWLRSSSGRCSLSHSNSYTKKVPWEKVVALTYLAAACMVCTISHRPTHGISPNASSGGRPERWSTECRMMIGDMIHSNLAVASKVRLLLSLVMLNPPARLKIPLLTSVGL